MNPQFPVRKLIVHVAVLLGALLVLRTGHSQGLVSQPGGLPSVSNAAVGTQRDSANPREGGRERTALLNGCPLGLDHNFGRCWQ